MDRDTVLRTVESTLKSMRWDAPAIKVAYGRVGVRLSDAIPGSTVVMQETGEDRFVSGSVFVEGIEEIQFRFNIED